MSINYRIYPAVGSGASGAGGGPAATPSNIIVPAGLISPYKGKGVRYVYRKYFLNITSYVDSVDAPIISGVNVTNVTNNSATVQWYTNEATSTQLDYGTTPSYGDAVLSGGLASGVRTVTLGSLSDGTPYYYRILATDVDDLSAQHQGSFNTLDSIAPVFLDISANSISSSGANIVWTTNEPATTRVKYSRTGATGVTTHDTNLTLAHSTNLVGLLPGTLYTYSCIGLDSSSNSGESSPRTFNTSTVTGSLPLTLTGIGSGNITASGAVITWTSNNLADTRVIYSTLLSGLVGSSPLSGSTGIPSQSYINTMPTLLHTGNLSGLAPGKTYYFKVASQDIFGQIASEPINTGYSFNTIDTVAPVITFRRSLPSATGSEIRFTTDEMATGWVYYDTATFVSQSGYYRNSVTGSGLQTGHNIFINGLTAPVTYSFVCFAADQSGNIGTDILRSFTTADLDAPIISNVNATPTADAIIVNWQTDELSLSVGSWGLTPSYELGTKFGNGGGLVLNHTVRFLNLDSSTLYYYKIDSIDLSQNSSSASGSISTLAGSSGDVVAPIISNINVSAGISDATISWDTDELATTEVEYTTGSFPGTLTTGDPGINGISGHVVHITDLPEDTVVYYNITSTDPSSNISTLTGQSFQTQASLENSNFFPGDIVCKVEFEVPEGTNSTDNFSYPMRVCVPVQDAYDLTLPWATEEGITVQRQITKSDAFNNPKIVEIIFPVTWNFEPAGTKLTKTIYAAANTVKYGWEQDTLPTDLKFTVTMPDGQLAEASLVTPENGETLQVRGDGNSSFMRTFKIFNRLTVATPNQYHPESKSVCVHSYITIYNKNVFPSYHPQIDVRVSNAWINEAAPAYRGAIYYQSAGVNYPASQPDGIGYGVTIDLLQHCMTETANSIILVKPMNQMPPDPHPDGNPNTWLGGNQSTYNLLYANDPCNHAFIQGYALEYRLALWNLTKSDSKTRAKATANLDHIGYVYEDGSYDYRSWSNVRSFTPLNIYCPTLSNSFTYNGFVGREAMDQRLKVSYNTIRGNLINGTYLADGIGLAGAGAGLFAPNNIFPVEYGPYRPCGPGDGGEPGGFQITPFDGFNHSKYALLWKKEDHKMKMSRHPYHMYSVNPAYDVDGEPSSIDRWVTTYNFPNPTMLNGQSTVPGVLPFTLTLDRLLPYFDRYIENVFVPSLGYTTTSGNSPWNAPSTPVTLAHSVGQGCSYNDDRVAYAPYWGGDSNGRFHLIDQYGNIDHAHQIRYTSNLIACAEMLNDEMMKDDLIMQAEINMLSYSHFPTSNQGYAGGYNLAEWYYGYDRGTYQYPGIISLQHQGAEFGRAKAWPLFGIVAAFTMGRDTFRSYAVDNIILWNKIFKNGVLPVGCLTRQFNPTLLIQHGGLSHNGIPLFLSTGTSTYVGAYRSASLAVPSALQSISTLVRASEGYKLVAQWITSKFTDSSQDSNSPYSVSLTLQQSQGLVLKIDNWITGWIANIVGSITDQTGSNTARYRVQFFLRSDTTGTELPISDSLTDEGPVFGSVIPNRMSWTIKQVNPFNGQLNQSFQVPQDGNGYSRIVVKLYVSTTSSADLTVTTNFGATSTVNWSSNIACSIQNLYGCVYDHAQTFEAHMMQMAAYAAVDNVAKYYDPMGGFETYAAIRTFYNEFYKLPPIDLTQPGAIPHSSSWLYYVGGDSVLKGAESWVIGVAQNANYPPGGGSLVFDTFTVGQGRFSHDPDATQYAPWSSYIGMLAEQALSIPFSTILNTSAYNPGFLMHKWCQMGPPSSGPNAAENHAAIIENRSATTFDGPLYVTNAAGCIGHIRWRNNQPIGLLTGPELNVPNVRIFINNESSPLRAELASTDQIDDHMRGPSVIDGDQTAAVWINGTDEIRNLRFTRARGSREAITLFNRDGTLGGPIRISNLPGDSIPFWLRLRLDENAASQTGWVSLSITAGDGPPGGGNVIAAVSAPPIDPEDPTNIVFNPSGEAIVHAGSDLLGAKFIDKVGNRFTMTYDDGVDPRQYVIDFSPGSGNDKGRARVYETYSDSWPMWDGGLEFTRDNGSKISPTGMSTGCTLNLAVKRSTSYSVIADYTDVVDSQSYHKRYTYTLTGKALRVNMASTDANNRKYSGNYTNAVYGLMSGVNNPYSIEILGCGATPIVLGSGNSTQYFIGNINDLAQSSAQEWSVTHPSVDCNYTNHISITGNVVSHSYSTEYKRNTTGGIVANVDETFSLIVSNNSKDCFVYNNAQQSPYYDLSSQQYWLLLGLNITDGPTQWVNSTTSYYNLMKAMTGWGMDSMAIYPFYWWTADDNPTAQSQGPNWYPAKAPGELITVSQFCAAQTGWRFGPYTMFNVTKPSSSYFTSGGICFNETGGVKLTVDRPDSERNASYNHMAQVAQTETTILKNNYGFTSMFHDVDTYTFNRNRDRLDQRTTGNNTRTIREGLIWQKKTFDNMRNAVQGPLWGEGSLVPHDSDLQWLYFGYLDSTERQITTNTGIPTDLLPSGDIRSPTRWWGIPEYEWYVTKERQINHGVSFDGRFFNPSDYDIAAVKTGAFQQGDLYPYTTGAADRYRAFSILNARAGFKGTNGYVDGPPYNTITHEQLVHDYYTMNAIQSKIFNSPCVEIKYELHGQWSGFDDTIKITRSLTGFTGAPTRIILEDQTHIYVTTRQPTEVDIGFAQISLNPDSYLIYNLTDNFWAFKGEAVIGGIGDSDGNEISYVNYPGYYEMFHGRNGTCTAFGSVNTTGANRSQFKVLNYKNNTTIEAYTGASVHPLLTVYTGIRP